MNRLVLIGNGYDLAAGLKTTYENFLVDYFKSALRQIKRGYGSYKDDLIEIHHLNSNLNDKIYQSHIDDIVCIDTLLKSCILNINHRKKVRFNSEAFRLDKDKLEVIINSKLLQKLLFKQNWRDIESFYFKELLSIYNNSGTSFMKLKVGGESDDVDEEDEAIKKLNKEFGELKEKLIDYIIKVSDEVTFSKKTIPPSSYKKIIENLDDETFQRYFNNEKTVITEKEIKDILVVNFNYTPTLGQHHLYKSLEDDRIRGNHIHGTRDNRDSIIFGYGDDSHPSYSKIEQCGNDEYLKNIKSFHYPKSKAYIDLMNFVEADQFEVQIIGHSLGLSDRVLLKSIFENKNCKLIKIYHRGNKEDMIHKYMALSRHCDNKGEMRRKILDYDPNDVVNEEKKIES
jgi:hypothetical protein